MTKPAKDRIAAEMISLYASAFARQGGLARAQKLTKERRVEIARNAAEVRWKKMLARKQRIA